MKARQKKDPNSAHPVRPQWVRWGLWSVGGLGVACLFVMIGIGLWFQNALNRFKSLEAETRTAYESLNEDFPFTVLVGRAPSPDRLSAYFRVRDGVLDAIPRRLDALTASFLESGAVRRIELLRAVSSEMGDIRRATQKHIGGLRSEQMSLNEYLWLHGMVVREIFRNGDPRRDELQKIAESLDRVFAASKWIEDGGFTSERFSEGLDLAYDGVGALPVDAISAMDLGSSTACVIDVLAANHTGALREQEAEESGS